MSLDSSSALTIRTNVQPGDIGAITQLHGTLYAREYGFNECFEAYVAGPLAKYVLDKSPRERLWIAERSHQLVGCIAIVEAAEKIAQLRWFLVDPSARGAGLGGKLLAEAVTFSWNAGYTSVILWTVSALVGASRLYHAAGFRKVEEKPPHSDWGVSVTEEKYLLEIR
jgi:N-acetylglutamate synthase-like GNAT family acetyltransferase